jgi:very-short-patch-repair endonuclease
MSRFLAVRRGHNARAWYNRINRMSVDFLVCTKDASVVAAVELDDASHQHPDRASADAKKELALNAAGVRLLRWNVSAMPDAAAIQRSIAAVSSRPKKDTLRTGSEDTGSFRTA